MTQNIQKIWEAISRINLRMLVIEDRDKAKVKAQKTYPTKS